MVLALALLPGGATPSIASDKTLHFLTFSCLMIWFSGVFRFRLTPWVALGLLAFGVLIELLQSQLSYRSAELADALSDAGGILMGWALAAAGLRFWTARIEAWITSETPS